MNLQLQLVTDLQLNNYYFNFFRFKSMEAKVL